MSSHLDAAGRARMVDVSAKAKSDRSALAEGTLLAPAAVVAAILENALEKGDALAVARVAAVMAVKNTARVIPLCHDLAVDACEVAFFPLDNGVRATCRVRCRDRTGAEMEALHGVAVALLTLYDMGKSIAKDMEIGAIRLLSKSGGESGDYHGRSEGERLG